MRDEIREVDSFFLSAVFQLADEWAVTITKIDVENRVLDFDCAYDKRHPFVLRLMELFGDSLE